MTATMHAKHSSVCPMCGQPIRAGEIIARQPYSAGRWAHTECVDQYRRDLAADDLDQMTYHY